MCRPSIAIAVKTMPFLASEVLGVVVVALAVELACDGQSKQGLEVFGYLLADATSPT